MSQKMHKGDKVSIELDYSSCCPEVLADDQAEAKKRGLELSDWAAHNICTLTGEAVTVFNFCYEVYFVDVDGKSTLKDKVNIEYFIEIVNASKILEAGAYSVL